MDFEAIQTNLRELEEEIQKASREALENDAATFKKEQLRSITRTILHLERRQIPVPKEIEDLRKALRIDLEDGAGGTEGLRDAYDRALRLTYEMSMILRRNLRKDLTDYLKQRRSTLTDIDSVSRAITQALSELGGSAHQRQVATSVETLLKGRLTPADYERGRGKNKARWLGTLYRARRQMVQDGRLQIGKGKDPDWKLIGKAAVSAR